MSAKMLLPYLGGAAAVWNTCLMFFQVTLVAGYAYAHLATTHLGNRSSTILHLGLLLAASVTLPITANVSVQGDTPPALWLLSRLAVMIGVPFFVLSSHSPLLQVWLARSGHPRSRDPYFLYGAGNAGSLAGLLGFPFLIEPLWDLERQSRAWAGGFGALVLMVLGCQIWWWQRSRGVALATAPPEPPGPPRWRERLQWLVLSAVPSSLLMGVTSYISANVASMPLLWVLPLTLYLMTFIIVFSRSAKVSALPERLSALKLFSRGWVSWVVPALAVALLTALIVLAMSSVLWLACLHLVIFFAIALHLHKQLAIRRPAAIRLGEFYLWMGLGGALGGVFNALIAPAIFTRVHEYPFVLALALMLRPSIFTQRVRRADLILPLLLGGAMAAIPIVAFRAGYTSPAFDLRLAFLVPALIVLKFYPRPLRFGLSVLVLLWALAYYPGASGWPVHVERSFYNVHRVLYDTKTGIRWLENGNTLHGAQNPLEDEVPLAYYHRRGPLGDIFAGSTYRRVAVIGLGVGAMLAYARPTEEWTFYEIDPTVLHIAKDSGFFSFIANSKVAPRIVLGDGRLRIAAAPERAYDLVVIDAFGSDSIPVHLLTDEAFGLYLSRLGEPRLLFHVSNRYFNLAPLVAALARTRSLSAFQRVDLVEEKLTGKSASHWVMVTDGAAPGPLWTVVPMTRGPVTVWTDSYSSMFYLLGAAGPRRPPKLPY
jgi:spermidine synthase